MLDSVLAFLVSLQGDIREAVADDLLAFAETHDWARLAIVFSFGIVFGAVHALTPGHSKTVLASYVAGSGIGVSRGVGVAAVLSVTHIAMSLLIAFLALPLVVRTFAGAGQAPLMEDISRGLIALIGLWMIYQAVARHAHAHASDTTFGFIAGLIPCPLTLFTMTYAIARGIPEAGLTFALAMLIGVALTLSIFAAFAAMAGNALTRFLAAHGHRMALAGRVLQFMAGALLVMVGIGELIS